MNSGDFNAIYDLAQRSTLALESIADSLDEMNSRGESIISGEAEIRVLTTKSWKDAS